MSKDIIKEWNFNTYGVIGLLGVVSERNDVERYFQEVSTNYQIS